MIIVNIKSLNGSQIKAQELCIAGFYDLSKYKGLYTMMRFICFVLSIIITVFLVSTYIIYLRAMISLLTRLFDNMLREESYGKYLEFTYNIAHFRQHLSIVK